MHHILGKISVMAISCESFVFGALYFRRNVYAAFELVQVFSIFGDDNVVF